jgi:hypothetical protein
MQSEAEDFSDAVRDPAEADDTEGGLYPPVITRPTPASRRETLDDRLWAAHLDWLFIQTVLDIRRRCDVSGGRSVQYQHLGLAPLLHKLLVQPDPLVDEVNRRRRVPLTFEARRLSPTSPTVSLGPYAEVTYLGNQLDPTVGFPEESTAVLRQDFWLRHTVMYIRERPVSMREAVAAATLAEHGTRPPAPRNNVERDAQRLSFLLGDGFPMRHRLADGSWSEERMQRLPHVVVGIARVTLRGLEPLVGVIQEELT